PNVRLVLHGIAGSGPGDAWAVGENGVITHWNGREWRLDPYRAPGHLRAVWATARNDVWAVGAGGLVVHFDGASWSVVPSQTRVALRGVWSAGNGDVWIVGESNVVMRREPESPELRRVDPPEPHQWHDVSGAGPRDVWIVGDAGAILRWDGEAFRREPSGTGAALNAVWFGTAADGWIVGDVDEAADGPSAEAIAIHWDGRAFTRASTGTREPLLGVWGSGAGDVWAVGQNFGRNPNRARPVLHWDGNAWSPRSAGAAGWYAGVWGDGSGEVWAVGCCEPLIAWHLLEWRPVTRGSMIHAPDPPLPIGDGRIHRRW
ncbi:MAG: hypothetical protein WCJ30_20895, partial [Deltaproteobacteria bacterium]